MKHVDKIEKFTNQSTKGTVDILSNVWNRNKGNDQFNKNSRPLLTLFTTWNVKEGNFFVEIIQLETGRRLLLM